MNRAPVTDNLQLISGAEKNRDTDDAARIVEDLSLAWDSGTDTPVQGDVRWDLDALVDASMAAPAVAVVPGALE